MYWQVDPIESCGYFPILIVKHSHHSEAAAVLEELDAFRHSLEEQDMVLTGLDVGFGSEKPWR